MENEFCMYLTKVLKDMELERSKLSHPFVGSEHLLLSLLKSDKDAIILFSDYGVTYDTFLKKLVEIVGTCKKNVEFNLYTPLLKRVINYASEEAKVSKEKVDSKLILESLLEENEGVAIRVLIAMDVDLDELYKSLSDKNVDNKKLMTFGKNLNESVSVDEKVVGREKEIAFVIETLLRKKKNNPLLIGDAGVGKSAIVEELARCINKGSVPKKLKNACIISVDMSSVVAGTKYRGEFEEKLNKIIEAAEKNSNLILFIDEIHTITSAGGAEGAVGAGDIFKPYLARGDIKVIGATTTDEYEKYILKDKALARRFETVLVKEPTQAETIDILNKIKGEYEKYHSVLISKKNILDIVSLSEKYIFNKKNPDKSIDFLDSVSSYVQIKNDNSILINDYLDKLKEIKICKEEFVTKNEYEKALEFHEKELEYENKLRVINDELSSKITLKDILKVLETKTNVPVLLNKKTLKTNFEKEIKKSLNEENYLKVAKFFNNKVDNLSKFSSILIKGNSDNIVNALKKVLVNVEYIKINGEDYEKEESIYKLIGVYQGYSNENNNYIFKKLKINPYAVIHIENYEKIAPNIKSMFKEIFKDEIIKDNIGNIISFKNSFLVISSKEKDRSKVGFDNENKNKMVDFDLKFSEIIYNNSVNSLDLVQS